MLTAINFLIIFFSFLILYQLFLAYFNGSIIEGMIDVVPINQVYRQYDKKNVDNTFLLAEQNAGNIEYLKGRIDDVQKMYHQVQDLSGNIQTLQDQVNGLVQAQQDYANLMTGGTAPEITGIDSKSESASDISNLVTE